MDKDYLKLYLLDNIICLEDLLERIGLVHIRINRRKEYISCGFSDSHRRDSINVHLNKNLSVKVWSRNDKIDDIIDLVRYQLGCSFNESINFIADVCGVKGHAPKIKMIDKLRYTQREKVKVEKPKFKVLSEKTRDAFVKGEVKIFTDDGIDYETQKFFDVRYDVLGNRVVFPIRDFEGNLITFKGRTLEEDYAEKGIPKYLYYHNFDGRYYLYNYFEHYFDIIDSEFLIILESEKSCQKLHQMGIYNSVAISKKVISSEQSEKINELNKKCIIAFDNDVSLKEIKNECIKLKGEVYYIKDSEGLLGKKDAPCDCGKEIFLKLLDNKIKFKREDWINEQSKNR